MGDMSQHPQWMMKTVDSTQPYIYTMSSRDIIDRFLETVTSSKTMYNETNFTVN